MSFVGHEDIVPLMAAGGLVTFSLDEKVTKKSSQKKASPLQAILPARFSDRPLPAFNLEHHSVYLLINLDFLFSSEEELRPKSDKTMVAQSVGRGIANFCMHGLRQKGSSGKKIAARGFVRFAVQRPVRQRSLSAESVFGYFCRDKSN